MHEIANHLWTLRYIASNLFAARRGLFLSQHSRHACDSRSLVDSHRCIASNLIAARGWHQCKKGNLDSCWNHQSLRDKILPSFFPLGPVWIHGTWLPCTHLQCSSPSIDSSYGKRTVYLCRLVPVALVVHMAITQVNCTRVMKIQTCPWVLYKFLMIYHDWL